MALIGFVFFDSAGRFIAINTFQIKYYANSALEKLALFFQIRFRRTQHAERGTSKLALFFQLPFRNTQHAIRNTRQLGLFFQNTLNHEEHEIHENWPRPVIARAAKQSQTFRRHYVYWGGEKIATALRASQ